MPSMRQIASAAATLVLATCATSVAGDQSLIARRPAGVVGTFQYNGINGAVYSEPSLFGLPNYQAEILGLLQTPDLPVGTTPAGTANYQGCLPYTANWNPTSTDSGGSGPRTTATPMIALVARGGCSFGVKAQMAQQAQAVAIIVYSSDDTVPLPKMAGGDATPILTIPGMLVKNTDGVKMLQWVHEWQTWYSVTMGRPWQELLSNKDDPSVWMGLKYSLLAPDDRVEYDLYTYPDEVNAQSFLDEFQDISIALGKAALFTPHYRVIDGTSRGCYIDQCTEADNMPCGTQCSNCGRYCRIDPNGNLDAKPDGYDQVVEITYAKALWNYGQANNQPQLWWNYVKQRGPTGLNCIKTAPDSLLACSEQAMKNIGLSDDTIDAIVASISAGNDVVGAYSDNTNALLEAELDWASQWQPLTSPYLFVNNMTYFGSFTCAIPATPSTCGPLSMICQGYRTGTAPPICGFASNGCESGVSRDWCGICGGAAVEGDNCDEGKGFPVGAIIGIIIACCVLIGGGVYLYMRRQNMRMKDDIDNLLKQYLPLEGSTNGGSGNGKSSIRDTNQNLRLIGNLDSADEPTDL